MGLIGFFIYLDFCRKASQNASDKISSVLVTNENIALAAQESKLLSVSDLKAYPHLVQVIQRDLGNLNGSFYLLSDTFSQIVGPIWLPGFGKFKGQFIMHGPSGLVYYANYPVSAEQQYSSNITFSFKAIDSHLSNPFIGWAPWAKNLPKLQDGQYTMAYAGIYWQDIEPQEGVYDFSAIEAQNQFDYCRNNNIRLILRLIADYPNSARSMQLPQWLYEKIGHEGTWYKNADGSGGFSPDYENPELIAAHQKLIAALGARYNMDPLIAFIQFGSLGHFGEWHVSSMAGQMPGEAIIDQYVSHYQQSFPDKVFMFRRPVSQLKLVRSGLYNDMLGDKKSTDQWLDWITRGVDSEFKNMIAIPDFWTIGPSGGEFAFGDPYSYLGADSLLETSRQIIASHSSVIGPSAPTAFDSQAQRDSATALLDLMGYRFQIQSVIYPRMAKSGSQFHVSQFWKNIGNSPLYYRWPVILKLTDAAGQDAANWELDTDTRQWLPGEINLSENIVLPDQLAQGSYQLSIAIIDPATNVPGILLANNGRKSNGYYDLGSILIQ